MTKSIKTKDSDQYNKWWSELSSSNAEDPGTLYRAELIQKEIRMLKVRSIVDAGCGTGEFIKRLRIDPELKGVKLAGFDVADQVIESNKKKFPEVEFFTLNLNEKTDLKKDFDLVVCSEVIEHLENWRISIADLGQMVKKGGYVLITTQSGKRYKHHLAIAHLQHFTIEEISSELKINNLKVIKSFYSGWPFMNLKNILTTIFYSQIEKGLMKSKKQGILNRFIFKVFKVLYNISSKSSGPQIFVLARKIS
ncbi:MAG TPA: class I SAM-dependent methyltransferase [Candidatus Saccharimonadales bacterium]|nr:class I SAM-dependent methyltransferase [Candidatus Saccharimonadales bacterium]